MEGSMSDFGTFGVGTGPDERIKVAWDMCLRCAVVGLFLKASAMHQASCSTGNLLQIAAAS